MTRLHLNPPPMFGLRIRLSKTEQAIVFLLAQGAEPERLPALLYMADIHAREYLGRPITGIRWTRAMLGVGAEP